MARRSGRFDRPLWSLTGRTGRRQEAAPVMRVARLYGPGDLRLVDEPVPEPPPGSSLVRVTAVGICGSDLHWYAEGGIGDARLHRSLVIGHEIAGRIVDGPRRGELVAVDPAIPCGRCETCRAGHPNLCPTIVFAGHGACDGGLREYLSWPTDLLYPLPDTFSAAAGAMLEPLGVAIHATDLAHLRAGMAVGVFGCGPIGLMLVQLCRAAGATRVFAVDPLRHRRAAALRLGADEAVAPGPDPTANLVDGLGLDVTFEVAGTDDGLAEAMAAARPGARVLLVGIPDGDRTTFPAALARRKGLTLVLVRRMKEVYPRAIALARRGVVAVDAVVDQVAALAEVEPAFREAARRTGLKTVIAPTPD